MEEQIESMLLTPQQMDERYRQLAEERFKYPYFYKLAHGEQLLYFVGAEHTYDVAHGQFEVIEGLWKDFLKDTPRETCVVLVEGNLRPVLDDRVSAIKEDGEGGLITYLAARDKVEVVCPEPDRKLEIEELEKKFSKDEVMYYYFARYVAQWHRFDPRPNFQEYIKGYFLYIKKVTGWEYYDFSVKHLVELHDSKYDHPFDPEDFNCVYKDSHPAKNQVSGASSDIRDNHILEVIKDLWKQKKNIFIVYGSGHAIRQEPALRTLVK